MAASCKPGYLFVLPWPFQSPGGVNQVVLNLYRECERAGRYEPLILIIDWSSPRPQPKFVDGFRCIHLRIPVLATAGLSWRVSMALLARVPVTLWRLRRILSRHHVCAVNPHYPTLSVLNFVLMKKLGLLRGARLLLSFHGLDIRNAAKGSRLDKAIWRWMIGNADTLVSCSDALAADVLAFAPASGERMCTVRNGVDVERIHATADYPLGHAMGTPRRYILNIGTFEHKKGHDILLEAFTGIAHEFPDVHLVILGRDGPTRAPLELAIRERSLDGRVICRVDVPHAETLRWLRDATLFALPSRAEGLPIVILEAGALGIPVVASRVDGIPEVIDSELRGWLVAPEDEKSLQLALRTLISDEKLRQQLGQQLYEHVAANFSWLWAWEQYSVTLR